MSKQKAPALHAVIIAGGAGERFWPASRRHRPKPFLRVVGGRSLLDATLARARRFARGDRVWIVCGNEHAKAMREESGLPPSRVLVEPERRNTAMAIAWAAVRIAAEDPDAVMAVLPADHYIPDAGAFAADIKRAAKAAAGEDVLVTLGVRPTRPDPGLGYIQAGQAVGEPHPGVHAVKRFVEKPDLKTARRYVESGKFLWNAGIFIWRAQGILDEIAACAPALFKSLTALRKQPRGRNRKAVETTYRRAPSLPIDVAVMEKSDRVWTVPVEFEWSDVGTWSSLAEQLGVGEPDPEGSKPSRRGPGGDADGNRVIAGDLITEDAHGNLVWAGGRLVALLGVDDLAVIDTDDVILVTQLSRSSDVRRLVDGLKRSGRDRLT